MKKETGETKQVTHNTHGGMLVQAALVFAFLAWIPFYSMPWAYSILIYALAALGLNLVVGYIDYLSFGHASFYALGVYGTAVTLVGLNMPSDLRWIALLVPLPLVIIVSLGVGYVFIRERVACAILMLALQQIVYFTLLQLRPITHGDEGIAAIPVPTIGNVELARIPMYFVFFAIFIACYFFLRIFTSSHFGKLLLGIRSNEERLKFLGYNIFRTKLTAFVFSAIFVGLAGSLYVVYIHYAGLETSSSAISSMFLFMVLVGGARTFNGPILGAAIYVILSDFISRYFLWWPLIFGLIFILIMRGARFGILDLVRRLLKRLTGREIDV